MLNLKTISKILGALLGIEALLMSLCLTVSLLYQGNGCNGVHLGNTHHHSRGERASASWAGMPTTPSGGGTPTSWWQ